MFNSTSSYYADATKVNGTILEINKLQNEIKEIQLKISNNVSNSEYIQFKDMHTNYNNKFKEYINSQLLDIIGQKNKLQNEIKDIQLKISNNVSTHEYKQFKDAQKDYDTRFKEYVNSQLLETKKEISELKKINENILMKLDDQIKLNAQLCDRIFEMKEEKFREGR